MSANVPSAYPQLPSATPTNTASSTGQEKPAMTNENAAAGTPKDPSWFNAFGGGGGEAAPDGTNGSAGFSAQAAASWIGQRREGIRPWGEFFNTKKFSLPSSLTIVSRLQHNLSYFFSNYLCLFLLLLVYCVLTSFILLLTVIAFGGLVYSIRVRSQKGPVVIGGQEIPTSLLYTIALIICVPLFALADASQVVYWIFGSSTLVILAHAILYQSEEVPGQDFEVVTVA